MRIKFGIAIAALVIYGGCSGQPSQPAANNGPPKNVAQEEATSSSNGDTSSAAVTVDPLAANDSSEKTTPAANGDEASTTPAPQEPAAGEGDVPATLEGVIGLVQKRQLDKALEVARAAAKADAENRQLRIAIIQLQQAMAGENLQVKQTAKANQNFLQSAKDARAYIADMGPLDPEEHGMLANVFYNEACALAKTRQTADAVKSLSEAMDYGYQDLAHLDSDKDFDLIRESEEFKTLREGAAQKIAAKLKEKALEELAANKPFDFDYTLNDAEGKSHKLADLKGKIVLVDVWGTWCPPCRMEIPHLIAVHKKYKEKGVEIVGLNYEGGSAEENASTITDFVKNNGITYPCLLGDDGTKDQIPDFQGFPTMLFLDRKGKVRLKHVGYTPQAGLEAVIDALLAEDAEAKPAE